MLALRFSAAAICPPAIRPRAMSFVIAMAVFSGVLAREVSLRGLDWLPSRYAGSYLINAIGAGICLVLNLATDFTPAVAPAGTAVPAPPPAKWTDLARKPEFFVSAIATGTSYMSMAALMAAVRGTVGGGGSSRSSRAAPPQTPVRMLAQGFTLADGANVVLWHVVSMYAPGLISGDLIRQIGAAVRLHDAGRA